jgi:hypothetical protein
MLRTAMAALAALALLAAVPAFACDGDCNKKKDQVAQGSDKKDDKDAKVACPCAGEGKECKCGPDCKCACSHCHKDKKEETKKT